MEEAKILHPIFITEIHFPLLTVGYNSLLTSAGGGLPAGRWF